MIRFRPHHFLCALGFQGKGYSDAFTANMQKIVVETLRAEGGDETPIKVTRITDDICAPCPKRRETRCVSEWGIQRLDTRHAKALGLVGGEVITWGEAQTRIREKVAPTDLSCLCQGCQWLKLGLCQSALERLHTQD